MLLTKEQQKFITKILRDISVKIKTEQDKEKDKWGKLEHSSTLERGIYIGNQSAYERCFHIAKTAAEESYEAEYDGADKKLLDMSTKIEMQATILEQLTSGIEQPKLDLMLDQVALLKNFARDIKLILRQLEK